MAFIFCELTGILIMGKYYAEEIVVFLWFKSGIIFA